MAPSSLKFRRLHLFVAIVAVALLSGIVFRERVYDVSRESFGSWVQESHQTFSQNTTSCLCAPCPTLNQASSQFDPINYVRGKPTPSFRDNLRPEMQYMTVWHSGGFTNDVMGIGNMIYTARVAERVPVLPPFYGEGQSGFMDFSDIFDLPRLRESLHMPLIEWKDVKDIKAGMERPLEPLGCWTLWAPYDDQKSPRPNYITGELQLGLDLSYTPIKEEIKLKGMDEPMEQHINLNKLAALSEHDIYLEMVGTHKPVSYPPHFPNVYPPDEHLMCMDFIYWGSTVVQHEWERSFSPVWKIGRQFRWHSNLVSHAEEYLMRILDVSVKDQIPPFIAIHVRRADFAGWCGSNTAEECFATLDDYGVRVKEIQEELRPKFKDMELKVIVTSDELDPAWWEKVRERGWLSIDHGPGGFDTQNRLGEWYTPLLDTVIQSMASGFIGTHLSTLSLLSQRRVEDWNGGVTRSVKWGFPGADNH